VTDWHPLPPLVVVARAPDAPAGRLALMTANVGVAAGASYRPDGHVRYYRYHSSDFGNYIAPSPWLGQNVYNTTAKHQTSKRWASGAYEGRDYYEFQVLIQNDGSTDRFKVHATGSGGTAKYFFRSTNITSAIVAGTYKTPMIGHGQSRKIKIRMSIVTGARLITITSMGDPSRKDAVKVKVGWDPCGC
jgi:hypothetical protein